MGMLNNLDLQGRMVADPELKDTNSGTKVSNFRIAWSEKYKEKESKLFLDCKAFSAQAEFLCKYFRKGQDIIVQGKLNTEEWETQDGQKRSKIVLLVSNIFFCGKKDGNGDAQQSTAPEGQQGGFTAVETDELPF